MRVLLIDVNCNNSSTGKIVYSIFNYCKEMGDDVALCYGRGEKISEPGIYKFGIDAETNLHALLARLVGLNGCFSFFSTMRLLKYIDEFKPDIVHIHELHAYFVNIGQLISYLSRKKIRIVWTFHCEYMYTGKCGYAYDCDNWKQACGKCPRRTDYPKSLFFDFTKLMLVRKRRYLENLNFIIVTPSQWLADRVGASFLKNKQCLVLHNGIDTAHTFLPTAMDETLCEEYCLNNKKIVLSVAPNIMDSRKGGKDVLKIAKQFDDDVVFVLIGANKTYWYSSNVLMIERTKNQKELAQWYSKAHLFLICSDNENFPTTCLEALACGTKIVGYAAGGTAETAPEGLGIFVSVGDIGALVDVIKENIHIMYSKDYVRNKAESLYSSEIMCKRYREIYQRGK